MPNEDSITRCVWAGNDLAMRDYHDIEWGVPVHEDRVLFEFLCLEGAQAGLSWSTILSRRANYRKAFDNFNPLKMSRYSDVKKSVLLNDAGIIRNRLKVEAFISNAMAYLDIQKKYGSLDKYLWGFVKGRHLNTSDQAKAEEIGVSMSKDLKRHGFRFVGPTICYAFMQATGMINDHETSCFRYAEIEKDFAR
ncbi:MAG TPA: DNA-3-methyladenine glycosylase I [Candidatus Sulfotelmatobacter sp.]|nr:DNA-3-methyladenine glycosylase I [Candidatus Sulfotelmatobacter sp.]